jgi:hypothetical protein
LRFGGKSILTSKDPRPQKISKKPSQNNRIFPNREGLSETARFGSGIIYLLARIRKKGVEV